MTFRKHQRFLFGEKPPTKFLKQFFAQSPLLITAIAATCYAVTPSRAVGWRYNTLHQLAGRAAVIVNYFSLKCNHLQADDTMGGQSSGIKIVD